ncbi:MAG: MBL fold metallo-hydrolase [Gemmataceae bacterium]
MPPAAAAGVLLTAGPGSSDLYMVRRSDRVRFFGGFWAFPGGKVDESDAQFGLDPKVAAAARELFEECGILIARDEQGSIPQFMPGLAEHRLALLEGKISFQKILEQLHLRLHSEDFLAVGNLITPPFTALRFDTTFYLVEMPTGQSPEVLPGELIEGRWFSPEGLIDSWLRGDCLVTPPTLALLQVMRSRPVEEWAVRLTAYMSDWMDKPLPPIFFAPEVQLLPLRTMALPPSTHTNAFLVGRDPAYLIDPGPKDGDEQQKLIDALELQRALGRRLAAVLLTHHHPDHVGAATLCSERYGVPICAHAATSRLLQGKVAVHRVIQDGERLDLGVSPDNSGPWHLEAIHTPGHAPGHLVFYEPHYRLLFAGDLLSTQTSMIIAPPDGDLAVYLDSLRNIQTLDCRLLFPAHGGASARPAKLIQEALDLRAKREQQILDALAQGPRSLTDLLEAVYRGVPSTLTRFAQLQLQAGLQKLEREGKAEVSPDSTSQVWRLCSENKTS